MSSLLVGERTAEDGAAESDASGASAPAAVGRRRTLGEPPLHARVVAAL
jgi:hypothetical protein